MGLPVYHVLLFSAECRVNSLRPKQPSELVQCLIGLEISRSLGRAEEVREVKVPLLQNAAVLSERMACFLTTSSLTPRHARAFTHSVLCFYLRNIGLSVMFELNHFSIIPLVRNTQFFFCFLNFTLGL